MAAPSRWVLSGTKLMRLCKIEHGLDPAAQPTRRFWHPRPQRIQHLQHGVRVDLINRHVQDWRAIFGDRFPPLASMLLAPPFGALRFDQLIGALAEGPARRLGFPGGLLRVKWVNALRDKGTVLGGLLSRLGEGHHRGRAKPGFALASRRSRT